jgi:hypothetical protein
MGNWWEIEAPDPGRPPLVRAVAYYRHSARPAAIVRTFLRHREYRIGEVFCGLSSVCVPRWKLFGLARIQVLCLVRHA